MAQREEIIIKSKKRKLYIALVLTLILLVSNILSYTPIVKIYEINVVLNLINRNWVNIIFIIIVLFVIYKVEMKQFDNKLNESKAKEKIK